MTEVSKVVIIEFLDLFEQGVGGDEKLPDDTNYDFSGVSVEYSPLQVVYIFFDTATYDEIERDVKVNLELLF